MAASEEEYALKGPDAEAIFVDTLLPTVIDPEQLRRIERTHRGFFYQHLFAVGCLLLAQRSGVTKLAVERDEDLELELSDARLYVQVKTRSNHLEWSDIVSTLENFSLIRAEHLRKARSGTPAFYIVCNAPSAPTLQRRYESSDWPIDVQILSPTVMIYLRFFHLFGPQLTSP